MFDEGIASAIAEENSATDTLFAGGRKLTEYVNKAVVSGKQAIAAFSNLKGEESPDFIGEDTSEILGAAKLRKV